MIFLIPKSIQSHCFRQGNIINLSMHALLATRLSPFRNKNFRNFFLAQTLSLVGTWSHDLARSWIIVSLTGSSGALGNVNLALAIPCLFLILQGGALVDSVDVKRLMQWTKTLLGVSALVLAAIAEFSQIQVWHLILFAAIEGTIVAFDSPAFQTLTVRLVERSDFQQAIALNSTNFHTSRMLGPIVAAFLLSFHGPSSVFLFDSLTYFLVVFVLVQVSLHARPMATPGRRGLREGLSYLYHHPVMRYRVAQLMLTICCIYPLMISVFRVFVKTKFNLDAHEFGYVFSITALGSMCGALTFAVAQPEKPIRALWFGVPMVFLLLLISPWIPSIQLTAVVMALIGFGLYLTFASLTVSMHLEVDEAYRGRMGSVIGLGFSSIGPLMSFPWGHLADHVGPVPTIVSSAIIFGLGSGLLAWADKSS